MNADLISSPTKWGRIKEGASSLIAESRLEGKPPP
jgi:hypothetical protein